MQVIALQQDILDRKNSQPRTVNQLAVSTRPGAADQG